VPYKGMTGEWGLVLEGDRFEICSHVYQTALSDFPSWIQKDKKPYFVGIINRHDVDTYTM
jgi:hypothetical protein